MMSSFFARFAALGWGLLGLASLLVPGCKFESCADTNSCSSEEDDDALGGQGGAQDIEDPDETPNGTGGDGTGGRGEDGRGTGSDAMGGEGAGGNATGGSQPALECDDGEVACEGECVDPESDLDYCGAEGTCEGDEGGIACEEGELCVDGECELDCPSGEVACEGSCIDPLTEDDYCGADSECQDYFRCGAQEQCILGGCAGWGEAGSADFGAGSAIAAPAGQVTIDGQGAVDFAWANPDGVGIVDLRTSQFFVDPMIWSFPVVHDSEAAAVGTMQMKTNSSGRAVLIWEQAPISGETMIWSAVRDPGSSWTDAVAISGIPAGADETLPSSEPVLTLDEEGNAYAVWTEDGDAPLVVNSLRAGETTWGAPTAVAINSPTPNPLRLTIESLSDGEALLLFEEAAGGWRWYSAVTADGVFGTAEPAFETTQPGWATSYASASNGQVAVIFWLAYSGATPPQFGLVSVYRDGAWSEPTQLTAPSDLTGFSWPKAVVDAAGTVMLSFTTGSATELWLASLPAGESEWSFTAQPVAVGTTASTITESLLAVDSHGNVQLAWIQLASAARSVWGARRRAGSTEFDTPRILEEWEADSARGLAMDFNEAGQGIITWWTTSESERTLGYNYFR